VAGKIDETNPNRGFPDSSFRYTPLQHLRVLMTAFAQGIFAEAPPGFYHWTPDMSSTEIVITDESPIHVEKVGQRPAITFTRGPVQFYSLGMDDMYKYDFDTDRKTKVVLVPGTMIVNCCSRVDIESENIAWTFTEHIWLLRDRLMKEGFFEIGRQPGIGAPSPAGSIVAGDGGDEWFVTAVTIPFQFGRKSAFTPLGQRIVKNIEQKLDVVHNRVASQGYPDALIDLPINIHTCPPPPFSPASDAHGRSPDPAGVAVAGPQAQPDPLNPATRRVIRSVHPNRPFRSASMRGVPIPIKDPCV